MGELIKKLFNKIIMKKVDELTDKIICVEIEEDKKNYEKEEKIKNYVYDKSNPVTEDMLKAQDYSNVPKPVIINPDGIVTILILDDVPYTDLLYQSDFKDIERIYGINIEQTCKIVKCLGDQAGYMAYKYAVLENNKIDIGILDITLGHRIKIMNEWYMEFDGIDVAIQLKKHNPYFEFVLSTAHTTNLENYSIKNYNDKCIKNLGHDLNKVYLNKNSTRYEKLYDFFYMCSVEHKS